MSVATLASPMVCIVDDDPNVRGALDGLLRSFGLATSTHQSLNEFRAAASLGEPSCLLVDACLPGNTGLDFLVGTAGKRIEIPVVLITGRGDVPLAVRAMKAGAIDVLSKPFTEQQLLDAVEAGINADRARRVRQNDIAQIMDKYNTLTRRERQVMCLVTSGLMNKQIAWELGLSEVTVKIHRGSVMRKMSAKSLPDLVRKAARVETTASPLRGSGTRAQPDQKSSRSLIPAD